ncbi:hypothetical protein SSCG_01769 [Streptomyces clavuligerus]|nr:hypothetical protein SSCG_01769 [Streptomyces clavuligerus]
MEHWRPISAPAGLRAVSRSGDRGPAGRTRSVASSGPAAGPWGSPVECDPAEPAVVRARVIVRTLVRVIPEAGWRHLFVGAGVELRLVIVRLADDT